MKRDYVKVNFDDVYSLLNSNYKNIQNWVTFIEDINTKLGKQFKPLDGYIKYVLELLNQYDGAITVLWGLNIFTDEEVEQYFVFIGILKAELMLL